MPIVAHCPEALHPFFLASFFLYGGYPFFFSFFLLGPLLLLLLRLLPLLHSLLPLLILPLILPHTPQVVSLSLPPLAGLLVDAPLSALLPDRALSCS